MTFLASQTPPEWAVSALSDVKALLSDHAYLERKAASNALELWNRWPTPASPRGWPGALAQVAREEAQHLALVMRELARRGGKLQRLHANPYANELRTLVRRGDGPRELVDRLLVSALIEERSRERFERLAKASDRDLAGFYRSLEKSEAGHSKVFVVLAKKVRPAAEVDRRLKEMAEQEAAILAKQAPGPRIHSGI